MLDPSDNEQSKKLCPSPPKPLKSSNDFIDPIIEKKSRMRYFSVKEEKWK